MTVKTEHTSIKKLDTALAAFIPSSPADFYPDPPIIAGFTFSASVTGPRPQAHPYLYE